MAHVRFQPVRLTASGTPPYETPPTGAPRTDRLSGLTASRNLVGLLTKQFDLLAPHPVLEIVAHNVHDHPVRACTSSMCCQPGKDLQPHPH
jgi:hypothetical protein